MRWLPALPALLAPTAVVWVASSRGVFPSPVAVVWTVSAVALLVLVELRRGLTATGPALWLAGLVGWSALAAVVRPVDPGVASGFVACGGLAVLLAALAGRPRYAAWGRCGVLAAGTVAAAWLIVERLAAEGRPGGPFENPNVAATVTVLALAVVPAVRWPAALRLGCTLVLLGGVLVSGSRAGMLAVVAVGTIWVLSAAGKRLRWAALVAIAVACAGLAVRVATDRDPLRYERIRIWTVAWRTAVDELPLGTGPGGYGDAAIGHNFPRDGGLARFDRVPSLAESDPLELLGSLGVPGLLLGAGLLAGVLRAASGSVRAWPPLAALAVTSAVHTQLPLPVVAWSAVLVVFGTLPRRPRRRLRMPPAAAAVAALAIAAASAVGLGAMPGTPQTAAALVANGDAALARGIRSDAALADAEAATWLGCQRRPRWGGGWRTLGGVRLVRATGRNEAALAAAAAETFALARRCDPLDVWAALGEGRAQRLLGRTDEAARALEAAVRLEPACAPAWLELARLHLDRGELAAARAAAGHVERSLAAARGRTLANEYERALVRVDHIDLERLRARCGATP